MTKKYYDYVKMDFNEKSQGKFQYVNKITTTSTINKTESLAIFNF